MDNLLRRNAEITIFNRESLNFAVIEQSRSDQARTLNPKALGTFAPSHKCPSFFLPCGGPIIRCVFRN